MDTDLKMWEVATGNAKWGVQQAIKTSLELVASEDIKMCWGRDDYKGSPCLINSINQMVSENADHSPSGRYNHIVSAFDIVNNQMNIKNINKDNFVAPIVAEILLANMGELKPIPEAREEMTPERFEAWLSDLQKTQALESTQETFDSLMNDG